MGGMAGGKSSSSAWCNARSSGVSAPSAMSSAVGPPATWRRALASGRRTPGVLVLPFAVAFAACATTGGGGLFEGAAAAGFDRAGAAGFGGSAAGGCAEGRAGSDVLAGGEAVAAGDSAWTVLATAISDSHAANAAEGDAILMVSESQIARGASNSPRVRGANP